MAYSNWGAFVYRNGVRQRDCEDVPVFGDRDAEVAVPSGARIFVNILKAREKYGPVADTGGSPWWERAHHAVLGRGKVRLCGYKSTPEIWVVESDEAIARTNIADYRIDKEKADGEWQWYESEGISGAIDGYTFIATPEQEPEAVSLRLTEPDGTVWTARCGYCIGAGHED